ncbi:uncharacterized protein LOC129047405 [Pongo abelii]|uniref:uncharacterized protein LOC129047405 n=1 Tax=Pongo abelii TaxID=9601 RepID=UPI0030056865
MYPEGNEHGTLTTAVLRNDDYSPPSKRQRPTRHHSHRSQNPPMLGNGKSGSSTLALTIQWRRRNPSASVPLGMPHARSEGHNSTASPVSQAGSRLGGFRGSAGESVSWPWRWPALLSLCCPSRMTGVSCFCHYTSHPLHHLLCSYKDPEKWNNRIADLCKQIEELSERKYDMNLGIQQVKIYNLINQLREEMGSHPVTQA